MGLYFYAGRNPKSRINTTYENIYFTIKKSNGNPDEEEQDSAYWQLASIGGLCNFG